MKKPYITLILHSVLLSFWLALPANAHQDENTMLQCHVEVPATVAVGDKVPLKFKLTNTTKKDLMVLKWNTPLEGWFGSSFKVTKDGKWVNYMGAMVKRFRPSQSDYAELAPGKSIEQTVNLAEGYDMKTPGNYKLMFKGRLQDVQSLGKDQPLSKERKLQQVSCNELTVIVR
ncbi:MAG: protease [Algicola sp.]|nr:protease [Algicola sp.]